FCGCWQIFSTSTTCGRTPINTPGSMPGSGPCRGNADFFGRSPEALAKSVAAGLELAVNVELLNTGTELMLGSVTNIYPAYFGRQLFPIGLRVSRQETIPHGSAIRGALLNAFPRCEILLVTGGLGPTMDDVTREVTAELLGLPLVRSESV